MHYIFLCFKNYHLGKDNGNWQVVKNVATSSLEVKKLVYIYLVHYAEKYVQLFTCPPIDMVLSKCFVFVLLVCISNTEHK